MLALQVRLEALLSDGSWTLRHLCHNNRGCRAEGDWGDPASLRFQHVGG